MQSAIFSSGFASTDSTNCGSEQVFSIHGWKSVVGMRKYCFRSTVGQIHGCKGLTIVKFCRNPKLYVMFGCTGVSSPNFHVVQGSTVLAIEKIKK